MEIPTLVREWLGWVECAKSGGDNPHSEAFDEFLWLVEQHPERAWQAIQAILAEPTAKPALGHLAAGPLEDLLGAHGPRFIDRIEQLAMADTDFAEMLGGVWRFTIQEDVWRRVQAAKREEPG